MSQQQQLLNDLTKTIDDATGSFNESIPGIQKTILNKITLLIKDLDISPNGTIKNSVKNLKVIGQLKSEIEKIVLNPKYLKEVKKFADAFKAVADLQHQYFNALSNDFTPSALLAEIQKQTIGTTIDRLTEAGLQANVTQYVQEILRVNITTGASYTDLVSQMRTALTTNKAGAGVLERYTKTIVTDSLNTFNRQYAHAISDDLGWEWWMYIGSNLTTTREWCEWLTKKKYVHRSELPEILKGHIDNHQVKINPKTDLWYGAKDITTLSNIIDLAGGWSCGHAFAAIPESLVPDSAKRLIGDDFIKPTAIDTAVTKINNAEQATSAFGDPIKGQVKTNLKYEGEERPYSGTDIYKQRRGQKEESVVDLNKLISTEGGQEIDKLLSMVKSYTQNVNDLPVVVKYNDKYYINDGHHRLSALKYLGKDEALVNLINLD